MKILVFNSGSSSIKYSLFNIDKKEEVIASGMVSKIGEAEGVLRLKYIQKSGKSEELKRLLPIPDHQRGLQVIQDILHDTSVLTDFKELDGIGHRVVHGGEDFADPQLINDKVLDCIRRNIPLAPLHNPANLMGIEEALKVVPDVPQVAVFDTAFHQTLLPEAYNYALPTELYTKYKIRRYGFHGTSHHYVAKRAAAFMGKALADLNLITLHLGNGASACAIRGGKSVDTSMGMTPLAGLVMGTRCGDLDPGVIFHLASNSGMSTEDIDRILNKESGLKGLCGFNDIRDINLKAEQGDSRADLALTVSGYVIKKYIGAYLAVLGRVDAVVFTAGIGENAPRVRERACRGLEELGLVLDEKKNKEPLKEERAIHQQNSRAQILVIPTDEELEIAQAAVTSIKKK